MAPKVDTRTIKPSFSALVRGEKVGRYHGSPSVVAKKIVKQILKENNDNVSSAPRYVEFVKNDYGKTDKLYRYGVNVKRVDRVVNIGNSRFIQKFDIKVHEA